MPCMLKCALDVPSRSTCARRARRALKVAHGALREGHVLAAVIADEELDFEQVLELTLDELRHQRQLVTGPRLALHPNRLPSGCHW